MTVAPRKNDGLRWWMVGVRFILARHYDHGLKLNVVLVFYAFSRNSRTLSKGFVFCLANLPSKSTFTGL